MIEDKLNLTYYCGEDLYSDGDVEDDLLRVVQREQDLEKYLLKEDSWPHLYHLSSIRENILEWYDFDPSGSLLEIGSGCGALSGLFCRKVDHVVAIELSKRRSMINATRNQKYNNLTIMLGNFEDIEIEEKFDYVTLIGVFEYSILYIDSDDPFGDMLKKAKSFLKPGGKLIIAIENKYGMKYFAGATEDHSGRVFDGLENYVEVERVRTFSRKGLEKMLKQAGFVKNDFYYPTPDYKLPNEIYSDKHLPSFGSIRNATVAYDRDRYELIDERLFADAACEDDMFPELSNSFLVISEVPATAEEKNQKKKVAPELVEPETEYVKYNCTRAPQYQISTRIYKDAYGRHVVEKKALRREARNHIRQLDRNHWSLKQAGDERAINILYMGDGTAVFPFIKGKSLESKVNAALGKKEKLLKAVKEAVDRIYDYPSDWICPFEQTDAYKEVFGETGDCFIGKDALKLANADSTFANFVETEDGKLVCLDYEWIFEFPVPMDYLKYRTIYYYFAANTYYIHRYIGEEEFLNEFGLTKDIVAACKEMDEQFQQMVHGEDRKYIYTKNYEKKVINLGKNLQGGENWFSSIVKDIHTLNQEIGPHRRDLVECEIVTRRRPEDASKENEEQPWKPVSEAFVKETPEEAVEKIKKEMSEELLKKIKEEVSEEVSKKIKEEELEEISKEILEEIVEEAEEETPEEVVEEVSPGVPKVERNIMSRLVDKAVRILKNEGPEILIYKFMKKVENNDTYKKWIESNEKHQADAEKLEYNPMFSVVIPVYNVADNMLRECIDSILNQTYKNFEIVLVDDASTQESVREVLAEYDPKVPSAKKAKNAKNANITVIYRETNGHISRATNDGIAAAKGEFVALCDCDDLYEPNALYEIAKKLNENPEYDFIYSDEDKIDEEGGERRDPFFKPDWSPETFMSYMYTCHLAVYRKSLLDELGGIRIGFEGSQDYDLVLRLMEKTDKIAHVPKLLYHWRMRKESTASSMTAKPYIMESTYKAKAEALERRGLKGDITLIPEISQYRVTYHPQGNPLVSIVIPSKDNYEVLKMCVTSVFEKTEYRNFEIVLVDNGSTDENKAKIEELIQEIKKKYGEDKFQYIYEKMEFNFSKMCNMGAAAARGELLLFLNDDIEVNEDVEKNKNTMVVARKWLSTLAGQAQVYYTGAVGCKLYYPDSIRLQHAGVVNYQIGPGHCFYNMEDNLNFYYGRNLLDYNFSVVTGACLMVETKKFKEIGGFDETFPVSYNDVDLCFRLVKQGYHNVLRNDVALIHHESVSRGLDEVSAEKEARRIREMERLYEKNPEFAGGKDPCYNPNLSPNRGDFSFNMTKAHIIEELEEKVSKVGAEYQEATEKIALCVSAIINEDTTTCINGWAYLKDKKNNNFNKTKLLLVNEQGEGFIFTTQKHYRSDVIGQNGSKKGLSLVGFESVILKECLPKGLYQIGVIIGKQYAMSDNYQII